MVCDSDSIGLLLNFIFATDQLSYPSLMIHCLVFDLCRQCYVEINFL